MMVTTSIPTLITFGLYLAVTVLLGWLGYLATHTLSDYILGGRRLNSFVTALSAGASDMSGWLLMGLPGAAYLTGIVNIWVAVGLTLGAWLNWRLVAARLRLYTEKSGNALTLPDYLANRFDDRSQVLRILSALTILTFFTIYCASGIVASARLFESIFHISYTTALWVGGLATISYVFVGGFLAISWTDTVQATLMILALIVTPIMVIYHVGGLQQGIAALHAASPSHLDLFNNLNGIGLISLLAWGLGYFGQPHILVRFMAAKSVEAMPKACYINIIWMSFCLAGTIAVGFFGAVYFAAHPELASAVVSNPETVFMEIAKQLFNPWLAGLLLAAILAAVMSTLSCQLLVSSSALTKDLYKTFLRPSASQKELVWCGRLMVLVIASLALWIASDPTSKVLQLVEYAWAGFGAAFGPVVLISLFWPRMTRSGAISGILTGALTVIVWKHYAWLNLYEIVPGFIFASGAIFLVSKLSQMPTLSIQQLFHAVNHAMDEAMG